MPQQKKDTKKGFSDNPLFFLLDILDMPGNALRTGVNYGVQGNNVLEGALKGLIRQENTSGVDINRSLGLTKESNTMAGQIGEGAAGLATSLALGSITNPIEGAALQKTVQGAANIGKGVKSALSPATLEAAQTLPKQGLTQDIGQSLGTFGRKIMGEEKLAQTKDNLQFSKIFRPEQQKASQLRQDIRTIQTDVNARREALANRLQSLNLQDTDKETLNKLILRNIQEKTGKSEVIDISPKMIVDRLNDSLRQTIIGKVGSPDTAKFVAASTKPGNVKRDMIGSLALNVNVKNMTTYEKTAIDGVVRQLNSEIGKVLPELSGYDLLKITEDNNKLFVKLDNNALRQMQLDPTKIASPEFSSSLIREATVRAGRLPGKGTAGEKMRAILDNFSARQGIPSIMDDPQTFAKTIRISDIDADRFLGQRGQSGAKNFLKKMQEYVRQETNKPLNEVMDRILSTSDEINLRSTNPAMDRIVSVGGLREGQIEELSQALGGRINPVDLEQILTESSGLFEEANKVREQSMLRAAAPGSKSAMTEAELMKNSKFIPKTGDFKATQAFKISQETGLSPEVVSKALPDDGKAITQLDSIKTKLFNANASFEQVDKAAEVIERESRLFTPYSGDRGAAKQVLESLVDNYERIKTDNLIALQTGGEIKTMPEIEITNIVDNMLRGVAVRGPEERSFIDLIKKYGIKAGSQIPEGTDPNDLRVLRLESLPLQNGKSAINRRALLEELGIPLEARDTEILLPSKVHEIVQSIGDGSHISNVLGLNPIKDRELFKQMHDRTKTLTGHTIDGMGRIAGRVMESIRKFVIATPGYHLRNQVGQMQNMWLSGMDTQDIAQFYPQEVNKMLQLWNKGKRDTALFEQLMKEDDVLRQYFEMYNGSPVTFEQNWNINPDNILKILGQRAIREADTTVEMSRLPSFGAQGWQKGNIKEAFKKTLSDNLDLTIATDHASRIAVTKYLVSKGKSVPEALKEASQIVFSRLDLGPGANDLMKNLFLFSGWTINNTNKTMREISKDPSRYVSLIKLTKGLQQNLGGENELYEEEIARGRFTIPMGNLGTFEPKIFDNVALQGLRNVVDPFAGFAGSLSPLIKTPLEMGIGRNIETGQQIGKAKALVEGMGLSMPLRLASNVVASTPYANKAVEKYQPYLPLFNDFFDTSQRRNIFGDGGINALNALPLSMFTIRR